MKNLRYSLASLLALTILLGFFGSATAQRLEMPQPSPTAMVGRTIGMTMIKLTYSSPGVKGREGKIWGKMVPYGNVWRAGANAPTMFEVDGPVMFAGTKVEAGTYAFFVVPMEKGKWKVVLNTDTEQWGAGNYDPKKNIAEAMVEPQMMAQSLERLTYDVLPKSDSVAHVQLRWEKLNLEIPVKTMPTELAKMAMTKYLRGTVGPAWYDMAQVAMMHKNMGMDLNAALSVINQSIALNPHFFNHYVKAEVMAAMGNYTGAYMYAHMAEQMGTKLGGNFWNAQKDNVMAVKEMAKKKGDINEKKVQKMMDKRAEAMKELQEMDKAGM